MLNRWVLLFLMRIRHHNCFLGVLTGNSFYIKNAEYALFKIMYNQKVLFTY